MNAFGEVVWVKEDIMNALELYDMEQTEDLIQEVIAECEDHDRLVEAMIEAGWNVIYDIIEGIKDKANIKD